MGHLCSCHRQQKYDKGYFLDTSHGWKTDVSLIRKLRWRCTHLRGSSSRPTTFPVANSPLPGPVVGRRHPHDDGELSVYKKTEADECTSALSSDRLRSSSSPSSPEPRRSAPPKPPRMRSMLVDDSSAYQSDVSDRREVCRRSSTSQLHVSTASGDVTLESASFSAVDECITGSGRVLGVVDHPSDGCAIDAVSKHATDLVVTSGVQPEVLVDFLRRRDVINDDTAAAARRCTTRQAACELLAEVVASKGDAAVSALGDALRMAGSAREFPECLEAIAALLRHPCVTSLNRFRSCSCHISPPIEEQMTSSMQSTDETGNGNCTTSLHGSIDVEVVYVPPTAAGGAVHDHVTTRNDVTSGFKSRRHRSMFIDPETISLPPSRPAAAESDRHDGLPVVSVTLVNICLDDELSDILDDVLFRFHSVRVLSFVKCHRIGPCLTRLSEIAIKKSCEFTDGYHLSRLKIRLCRLGSKDDERVIADFAGAACRKLRELFITGSGITTLGCDALASGVVTGSRYLTDVDVGFNDISDVGRVADALSGNCSLRRLRMRGNGFGATGATRIFDALRRNYRLELLDISGNPIGESKSACGGGISSRNAEACGKLWAALAEALLCNRTLRQLNLERCSLGMDACQALTRALRANTTLTELDLSMNPDVGDLGVAILAGALRQNRRSAIQVLSLNMCAVGNIGLRSLLDAIRFLGKEGGRNTTRLRRIKLCYNLIDGKSGHGRRQSTLLDPVSLRQRRSSLTQTTTSTRPVSAGFRFDLLTKRSQSTVVGGGGWMKGMEDGTLLEGEELLDCDRAVNAGSSNIPPVEAPTMDLCEGETFQAGRIERSFTVGEQMPAAAADLAASTFKVVHSCIDVRRNVDKAEVVIEPNFNYGTGNSAAAATWHSTSKVHATSEDQSEIQRRRTMTSDLVHGHKVGRSASAILDSRHGRGDYGRTEMTVATNVSAGSAALPCDDNDELEQTISPEDVYSALCDVLASNPGLKILLWGNQLTTGTSPGNGAGCDENRRDSTFVVESESSLLDFSGTSGTRGVDDLGRPLADVFSRSRHQYSTLPRNYELNAFPTSMNFSQ